MIKTIINDRIREIILSIEALTLQEKVGLKKELIETIERDQRNRIPDGCTGYERYVKAMSAVSGIAEEEITSQSRKRPLPILRQMIMHEMISDAYTPSQISAQSNFSRQVAYKSKQLIDDLIAYPEIDREMATLYNEYHTLLNAR